MPRRSQRGFTLLELMVVVAIVVTIAVLSWAAFGRQKPRQSLNGFTLEFGGLLHGARQTALATGKPVVVMLFPTTTTVIGTGRAIIYQDGNGDFFLPAAAVNFGTYVPSSSPAAGTASEVLEVLDFPGNVVLGPVDGQGAAAAMPAPFANIAINQPCVFCTGANNRGAIVFDPVGSVTFYSGNGAPAALPWGASVSFYASNPGLPTTAATGAEVRTIAIVATTGALRTINWAP
jgi:prepilin-type N-terminal cleavage/methylation domain-containing protein